MRATLRLVWDTDNELRRINGRRYFPFQKNCSRDVIHVWGNFLVTTPSEHNLTLSPREYTVNVLRLGLKLTERVTTIIFHHRHAWNQLPRGRCCSLIALERHSVERIPCRGRQNNPDMVTWWCESWRDPAGIRSGSFQNDNRLFSNHC